MKGKIKTMKDGYGFIAGDDGKEYYFNRESLSRGIKWQDLLKGTKLDFEVIGSVGGQGRDRARNCKIDDNETDDNETVIYLKENVLQLSTIESYDEFCDNALEYAKRLQAGKVTTSMLRKVYLRVLNASNVRKIKMLRPQFAYIAGRETDKPILKEFMNLLDSLVRSMEVENQDHLKNLKQFMEAIVAYMKYVGDKS